MLYYKKGVEGMAKEKVQIKDKSFDSAGLKKDYKDSIIEYILNGFEANAKNIKIIAEPYSAEMSQLMTLKIIDDGDGIDYETRKETFNTFLISQKEKNVFFDRANKGKGRFTFYNFSNIAKWTTVYSKDNKKYNYTITINKTERDICDYSEPIETTGNTGTCVEFYGMTNLKIDDIVGEDLKDKIISFFAKYLYLHKDKHIFINGKEISYSLIIDENLSETFNKSIGGKEFEFNFIKWLDGSNQKSYAYYVDDNYMERYKEHTKCNNNAVKFYHSLFIKSGYFNNFAITESNEPLLEPLVNQSDKVFKELQSFVYTYVKGMLKKFIREEVPGIIQSYIDGGLFPEFSADSIGEAQKEDLKSVVEEVYFIQPNLFYKSKKEHKKAIIGCLNLILKTDERENIITILDSIQKLTAEERSQLANILRKYEPSSIIKLLDTIKNRQEVIAELKTLIYENTKFTNERNHIQKIIEENYWLFGEEYNLVSSDERLSKVLIKYIQILDKKNKTDVEYSDPKYKDRRPDIFISGNHDVITSDSQLQENIIIELKAPSVNLTTEVYRQIEDYMTAISKDPEFTSSYVQWKFVCVCNEIDDEVKARYEAFKEHGKKCLVHKIKNYEIYAYTWADVFTIFNLKHNHLYKKLKEQLNTQKEDQITPSRELADEYTSDILAKSKYLN